VKASEVHALDDHDLIERLRQAREEAFNLRFQKATGQLENTSRMQAVRRDAARVKTILNEKAAAAAGVNEKAEA